MHTFFSFEKNVSYIEFAFHSKNPQINYTVKLGVSKKTEKPIKPRKPEKNNRINRTELNSNRKNWKKSSQNRVKLKKLIQTGLNRLLSKKNLTEPKSVGLNRFWFSFGFFFLKISVWLFFFIKTERTENSL
jgi:hypothetical protein